MSSKTTQSDSDEIDLGALLLTLWKGKATIALASIVVLFLGVFNVANTFATYQADALLQLESRSAQLALPAALQGLTDDSPVSTTEIEVIRSRMILGRAVAELNLDWKVDPVLAPVFGVMMARYRLPVPDLGFLRAYARPGETIELTLLSVPPRWIGEDILLTVTEQGYSLLMPTGETADIAVGDTYQRDDLGFAMRVGSISAPIGRQYMVRQIDERQAIADLRAMLTVAERGRGSGILEIRFSGDDNAENVRILNAIAQAYVRQNVARSAAEAQSSLDFINEQLPSAEAELRRAEAALNAYRQQQAAIDLSFETQNILTQINAIEGELSELQRQEDEISQLYTSSHPTYRQLLDQRARLEERANELRAQASNLPETQREILNLTRDVELAQGIYTELLTRRQEVEVLRASTVGSVRIIDAASAGLRKIAPRTTVSLAMALVIGFGLGCAIVLVRAWLRKGIQDSSELEKLGLPVFVTIPYSEGADSEGKRRGKLQVMAVSSPTDLAVEAFRSMRTSLHFGMLDAANSAVAITSTHPGAGKSFCSVNFAAVAALSGQRVCLIDADMRRGYLRRYFGIGPEKGLSDILSTAAPVEECIFETGVDGLSLIPAGAYPPNPSELLMRSSFAELIANLNDHFDLIVLDTPPVLAVTDPVIIARVAGTTILVARHDLTVPAEIEASLKAFESANQKLAGAIMNGFDPKKAKAGSSYSYGYRYSYETRSN